MPLTHLELIQAAAKLWGKPTSKTGNKWRYGAKGSKSIMIDELIWHDFETGQGGGVVELCKMAGIEIPKDTPPVNDKPHAEIVYKYADEKGWLLFEVVRAPGHKFWQRRPFKDGWVYNMRGVRRILYRLPQLIASKMEDMVFVVEGEKDADNVAKLGLVATTNPGGAGKWRPEYSAFLKGRCVAILPDNDQPGQAHAEKVRASLSGIANSVRIITLPGLAEKGDVSDWIKAGGTREKLVEIVNAAPPNQETPRWIEQCSTFHNGQIIPNLDNAAIGLENDPKLKNKFAFDTMMEAPMTTQSEYKKVDDEIITNTQRYLQQCGLKQVSRDTVKHAIFLHAKNNPINPFLDELKALKWDGEPRVNSWLSDYLGAENNDYTRAIGPMFLRSMIARAFKPGCKVDYMLVLEGEQGILKSMACRILAGEQYFTDSLPELGSGKDVYLHLRGIWLAEVSEMHAFNRAEATTLKAFLTQQTHRYRPPYASMEVDEPRRCVFIGTSNKDAYLRDETGGRRFWPVKCTDIRIDWLKDDRDQLLAEAITQFLGGIQWWPERKFELEHIQPEQEKRFEIDPWFDDVAKFIDATTSTRLTIKEVAGCVNIPIERLGQREQYRLSACLRAAGWTAKRDKNQRWWEPEATTKPQPMSDDAMTRMSRHPKTPYG